MIMNNKSSTVPRSPVVAVVGHIDHGKSTLLDYVRKTNVVEGEAGGITQHLSAYEAVPRTGNTPAEGRTITFLDTPGHAAFTAMRSRGLSAADVAVLIVSAEDGVKPQTMEAVKLIEEAGIPFVVALTKIDKESANIERAKNSLLEHGIYLEGMGGTVPFVGISSKTGEGVPELLDLILLTADIAGLSYDPAHTASGIVIESHVESKRGSSATLVIKDGSLSSGQYVVAGAGFAPVRILENFAGKAIRGAHAGQPVRVVGFSSLPQVGGGFVVVASKKEAETLAGEARAKKMAAPTLARSATGAEEEGGTTLVVPVVIKTDAAGTGDAVVHELGKLPSLARLELRVLSRGVGTISEADVKIAAGAETPGIVLGFHVKVDSAAQTLAERLGVTIATFDIIYKIAEWLGVEAESRRPRERVEEVTGSAKVLRVFNTAKRVTVLGGRVEDGSLLLGSNVRIMRRDLDLGRGIVETLQSQKAPVKKVEAGTEFGAGIKTDVPVAPGDRLEAFTVVTK